MSTTASVDSIISSATALAASKAAAASAYSQSAQLAAQGYFSYSPPVVKFTAPSAPIELPPSDNLGSKLQDIASLRRTLYDQELANDFSAFLADYFPTITQQSSALVTKLETMITEGGTALPPAIENAIWDRARQRLTEQYVADVQQATDAFAKRGFTLPPGALLAREREARQKWTTDTANFNRDLAIQQFQTEIENLKFAIAHSQEYVKDAIQQGIEYIRLRLAAVIEPALQEGEAVANAEAKYYELVQAFFNSEIENARLTLSFEELVGNINNQAAQIEATSFNATTHSRVQAAVAAASAMGDIASAALSSQNTLAHIATETILSGTTQ